VTRRDAVLMLASAILIAGLLLVNASASAR